MNCTPVSTLNSAENLMKLNNNFQKAEDNSERLADIEQTCIKLNDQFSSHMTELENIKSLVATQPPEDISQYHTTQMKELETLKSAILSQPPPAPTVLDWSHIKLPPPPPLPESPPPPAPTTSNHVRLSHDSLMRKCNVIIRGLPCPASSDPVSVVRSFLKDSKIDDFMYFEQDLVTAHILNRYNNTCTIRIVFNNHWTVEHILNSAHKLKQGPAQYRKVYLNKDRTPEEMKEHKTLLAELKRNILEQKEIRWIILDGKVIENGQFPR